MAFQIKGNLDGGRIHAAIVASRYNEPIVEKLVDGAIEGFIHCGVRGKNIKIFWVPGAFEIPLTAKKIALSRKFDCIVCVGCVIQGETHHYDHIARNVSKGIAKVSRETGVPTIFSVILTDDAQKAWERAGGKFGNRGTEGALAAVEMTNLLKLIR